MLADEEARAGARNFEAQQKADRDLERKTKEINAFAAQRREELGTRAGGSFGFRGAADVGRNIQQKVFSGAANLERINERQTKELEKANEKHDKAVGHLGNIAQAVQNPPQARWS